MEPSETSLKKPRKRIKQLCAQIQSQMEFYFGDANLHKDRFLKKQIDESPDGFIDLEVFHKFNKMQALTTDISTLAKALSKSSLLEVSSDGKRVKRKVPLGERKNVDSRTVYVECLPPKVEHEWVKKTFETCGIVEYVSLPKFQSTGDIKGFGFVEFASEEAAQKACQVLNNPPPGIADQMPGKFPRGGKDVQRLQRQLQSHVTQPGNAGSKSKDVKAASSDVSLVSGSSMNTSPGKKTKKRKRTTSCDDTHEDVASKRNTGDVADDSTSLGVKLEGGDVVVGVKRKLTDDKPADGDSNPDLSSSANETSPVLKKKRDVDEDESNAQGKSTTPSCMRKRKTGTELGEETKEAKKVRISNTVEVREQERVKKKRRKKKSKEKSKEKSSELPELRVIPKKEWLQLRNEYVALQKASMKQMKETLRDIKKKELETSCKKPGRVLTYTPGVIVQVKSTIPMTRKLVKELLSPHGEIAYIDLKDGESVAHLRCENCEAASNISQAAVQSLTFTVLAGVEDKLYWDKILADQEAKLNRKTKNTKKRGKDKLIERAEKTTLNDVTTKHIVFDD